jgi:hypothetical protein
MIDAKKVLAKTQLSYILLNIIQKLLKLLNQPGGIS